MADKISYLEEEVIITVGITRSISVSQDQELLVLKSTRANGDNTNNGKTSPPLKS